jgi:hypothetical protein
VLPPATERWLLLKTDKYPIEDVVAGKITPSILRVLDANKTNDAWRKDGGTEWVVAYASKQRLLVLSHTCDIAAPTKKLIQVAPIFPNSILTGAKKSSLIAGDFRYRFQLPQHNPQLAEDCFAELTMMASIPKAYFRADRPPLRLTPTKSVELQSRLAGFFARPFGFAPLKDSVPRTGTYLCARCFYKAARITRLWLSEGTQFPPCEFCGGKGLWVHFAEAEQNQ